MEGYGTRTLRVYVVDDHDIVRRGLRDLLAAAHDVQVVGDTGSAREAVRVIPELRPDVMLLDVQLQDGSGIQVCRQVRAQHVGIRGLLLTSSGDDEAMVAALLADAGGYLIKLDASSRVLGAIRRVGAGKSLVDTSVRARVVEQLRTRLVDGAGSTLTPDERSVLDAVLDGRSDPDIAGALGISTDEVSGHVSSLVATLLGVGVQGGRHRRSGS